MELHKPADTTFHAWATYDFTNTEGRAEEEVKLQINLYREYRDYIKTTKGLIPYHTWLYRIHGFKNPYAWEYGSLLCTMAYFNEDPMRCDQAFHCPLSLPEGGCMEFHICTSGMNETRTLERQIILTDDIINTLLHNRMYLIEKLKDIKDSLLEMETQYMGEEDDDEPVYDDGARDSDYEEGR